MSSRASQVRFCDRAIPTTGTAENKTPPLVPCFSPGDDHFERKQRVLAWFGVFFERFFGLGSGGE